MKQKRQLTAEEEMLRAYSKKVKREAVFKSAALGVTAGALLSAAVSAVSFATQWNTLWIALGVWAGAAVLLTVLFYFAHFRADLSKTAERVDGIGLEERVITMVELAGKDDLIAQKQRTDTRDTLGGVSVKQMRTGISKLLVCALAAAVLLSSFMTSYSTVLAVRAEEAERNAAEEPLPEDDRIIKELIEQLRDLIKNAPVDEEFRGYLNRIVDNLESSLKRTDSLEVKKAKISETAQEIHKLIEEYLSRTTIGQELQKHDTTKPLGDAVVSGDPARVEQAFQEMYDSIEPHVMAGEYDILSQTADDIEQSIRDAAIKDEALADALQKLADALRAAIPKEPPHEGEEEHVGKEVMDKVQDAFQHAADEMKDALAGEKEKAEEDENMKDLDKDVQDAIKDALDKLGGNTAGKDPEEDKEPDEDEENGDGGEESNPPPIDGDVQYDSVIDGQTPYDEVYDEYRQKMEELLQDGDLSDEDRKLIEDYFGLLG